MSQIGNSVRRTALTAAAIAAAIMLGVCSAAHAQQVVLLVDGQPITELDIQQRMKFIELSTHKAGTRQEAVDGLIDEILEVREAKQFSVEVPESEVDKSYAAVAERMSVDTAKLSQMLAAGGASEQTFKHKLRADIAWNALIRGRYKASLEVADTDVEAQLQLHKSDEKGGGVGYEYTMRPIIFIVPHGSGDTAFEARRRDADALRSRFQNCGDGIPFARALREVAVRDQVLKFSADLPQALRDILDNTEVGHLTPPETTEEGVQMFAVCGKKQTKSDTPEKKQIRDEMFQKRFGAKAKRYLQELRRAAMIEYKQPQQ